jgi:hypothetical protein
VTSPASTQRVGQPGDGCSDDGLARLTGLKTHPLEAEQLA